MTTKSEIYNAVDDRRDEMVAFFTEFLDIETENPPGRNYREGAEFLASAMTDRDYDVESIEIPESVVEQYYPDRTDHDRVNVLGKKAGEAAGPDIHFTGHFDVVPAGEDWEYPPYDATVENDIVYARGSSDMKSGIVASLFAIDALEAVGIPIAGSITQSMTIDEETGGFTGLGYLVEEGYISAENTDYCIYTECFDSSRVCLGHRGVLKFAVTTHGEKAHGCMAHGGKNAVNAMNDFLTRIDAYEDELHERTTDLPVSPPESRTADISSTMIDGGYSENVVPDRCTATFYRVLVPGETIDSAREEVHDLMDETEIAAETTCEYDEIMYAEPANVPADGVASQTYVENAEAFHDDVEFVISPGSDDQRFVVNDAGIDECIVYGPGLLEQAHVVDEHLPIEELVTATKVMAAATADLSGALDA